MKKMTVVVTTLIFIVGLSLPAVAAKAVDCKIVSSTNDTVTMSCGKKATTFKKGDQVQVKKKPPEGC